MLYGFNGIQGLIGRKRGTKAQGGRITPTIEFVGNTVGTTGLSQTFADVPIGDPHKYRVVIFVAYGFVGNTGPALTDILLGGEALPTAWAYADDGGARLYVRAAWKRMQVDNLATVSVVGVGAGASAVQLAVYRGLVNEEGPAGDVLSAGTGLRSAALDSGRAGLFLAAGNGAAGALTNAVQDASVVSGGSYMGVGRIIDPADVVSRGFSGGAQMRLLGWN